MAAAQGFTEVSNYSFMSEEMARAFDFEPAELMEVANPIVERSEPVALEPAAGHLEKHFRTMPVTSIRSGCSRSDARFTRTAKSPHFAAAIYAKDDGVAGLLELKRLAECLLPEITVRPAAARTYEHPQRAAERFSRRDPRWTTVRISSANGGDRSRRGAGSGFDAV